MRARSGARRAALVAIVGVLLLASGLATALGLQRYRRWGRNYGPPPELPIENMPYNARFTFNRIMFTPAYWGRGPYMWGLDLSWNHDYPRAERNLMQILDHLTGIHPNMGGGNIYSTDDPDIFKYPLAYLSEPGAWTMTDEEVEGLRNFLLKGGFLVVDDFPGDAYWNFEEQIQRVLPGAKPMILDTTHELFHTFFDISQEDILNQDARSIYPGRGLPVIYGIYEENDPNRRLLVVANYNMDVGESWEFSDSGYIPIELSNNSFKLGVNYVMYALLH